MTPTTWFLCSGLAITAVAILVIVYGCIFISGTIAQEEDRRDARRS